MRFRRMAISLVAGVALAVIAGTASADPRESDAEHCVSLNLIDRTEVISDAAILFYMKNDQTYVNRLPHKCPGLRHEETFMYRTSIGQLCDLDIITVLDDAGFGFMTGPSCGLGTFHPVSEDRVAELKAEQ